MTAPTIRDIIRRMHDTDGLGFAAIGRALGWDRQRVWACYHYVPTGRPVGRPRKSRVSGGGKKSDRARK